MDMEFMLVPMVIGLITLGIYRLFELFVCRKERIMLIEKMSELPFSQLEKGLSVNYKKDFLTFSALKWGCLLVGLGAGIFVSFYLTVAIYPTCKQWGWINYWEILRHFVRLWF